MGSTVFTCRNPWALSSGLTALGTLYIAQGPWILDPPDTVSNCYEVHVLDVCILENISAPSFCFLSEASFVYNIFSAPTSAHVM